jgi:GR25 family glycosyltransferase involved in LPS biosynthesis
MNNISNQTFENDFIINLIAHFISKKYNIDYSYSFFEDFKKLGINLFLGQHYYIDSLEINPSNFFDFIEESKECNDDYNKLTQNIKINETNLFDYQTPQFTQILNDYFQIPEIKENIITSNLFKERYNNNEDLFIFITNENNEKMTLKNIAYYDSILSKLKFNNGYFMVEKDSIDLKIYIKLIEKYNLKILNKSTIENIMFASSCKYLILSNHHNNNLSYILGLISYHSTLFNKPDFHNHIPSKKHNYIINLDRRKDRWNSITNLIKSSSSLREEDFIRFSAFDAYDFQNEINRFAIHEHPIINDMKINKKSLKIGEVGVYLSHTLLLKQIIENDDISDDDLVSIYEDDFCLCDNFEENYANFKSNLKNIELEKHNIEFLYTGGRFWSQYIPQQIDNDYFEKVSDFDSIYYRKKLLQNPIEWDRTALSYSVKKSICNKVYNLLIKNFIENFRPVDHVYVSLYKDIKMYDYLPHLFWSPFNSGDTDIQNNKLLNYDNQIDSLPKIKELDEKKEEKKEGIKIAFIAFWHDFNYMDNVYTKTFLKKYKNIEISTNPDEANILIVGSFINQQSKEYIENLKAQKPDLKTILCITEPIGNFYQEAFQMLLSFPFDKVFGCINNDGLNRNKYPLYLNYFDYEDTNIYSLANNYVKNIELKTLITKDFCCLINSHDQGNTRGNIHSLLNLIKVVTCPGKLFNNCSNEELNKIGNVNYIKNFVFNICGENFKTQFPGYITEKLLHACLGGAIPIYFGSFDEVDENIFNKNRIIFYDAYDINSIVNTYNFIKDLYNNPEKLLEFYRQPIFQDSAYETVMNMKKNMESMFDGLIKPSEKETTENYSLDVNNILWSKGPLRNDYSKKGTEEISSEIEIIEYMSVIKNNENTSIITSEEQTKKNINDLIDENEFY